MLICTFPISHCTPCLPTPPQPSPPPPLLICNVQRTFRICLSGYTDREESEDEKRRKEWWTPRSLPILQLVL